MVRISRVNGSAFLRPRSWHQGVSRTVRGLVRVPTGDRARRNAQAAAADLASRRREREDVDRFLTAHAADDRDESVAAV
jgi:hypothetical protein